MNNKPVELRHATWVEEDGSPTRVFIYPEHVFSVLYMPSLKATVVQSTGAAYMTVLGSVEEINAAITRAKKGEGKNE